MTPTPFFEMTPTPFSLSADDFTVFGLPPRYALDAADLDKRWRDLQARVHPDRFAAEGAAAQRVAMQWSVRVNEAYRRLKDPIQRGALLCELQGIPIDAERNTAMPPAFLVQQMEWREALEEAGTADAVADLEARVRAESRAMQARLAVFIDGQEGSAPDLNAAAQQVRALMFVQRFLQDIARRADRFDRAS
jgi:molecular chaperone HscB